MVQDPQNDDIRRMLREFRESVSEEFARNRDDISALGQRLDKVDQRLDGLDQRLGAVERRVTSAEGRVVDLAAEMRTRMLTMETAILNSIGEVSGHVRRLEGRFDEHLRRHHGDAA